MKLNLAHRCRKRKIWSKSQLPASPPCREPPFLLVTFQTSSTGDENDDGLPAAIGNCRQVPVLFGKSENINPISLSALTNLFCIRHIGYWRDRFDCLWCSPSVWFTMGRKFGSLTKGKNIVTYSLSPFEQRAFAGVTKSIANMARRVRTQLPYQLPAFISGILLYTWAMEDFRQRNRKNPKDFENDE